MHITVVLEHQMSLGIFDAHIGAQCMEDIFELWHYLVPFMSQCGPFCIQVIITSKRIVFFPNNIPKGIPSDSDCK